MSRTYAPIEEETASFGAVERSTYAPDSFPKRCGCGRVYTEEEWRQLPFPPGDGDPIFEVDDGEFAEMRNCPCTSTISVALSPEGVEEAMIAERTEADEIARRRGGMGAMTLIQGGQVEKFAIEKDGKYLTLDASSGRKWFGPPGMAYSFSREEAESLAVEHAGQAVPLPRWDARTKSYRSTP
jgi:hypothetical protein